jgi:hypothetical protein
MTLMDIFTHIYKGKKAEAELRGTNPKRLDSEVKCLKTKQQKNDI